MKGRLGDLLEHQARVNGNGIALIQDGKEHSYSSVNDEANALAMGLIKEGVSKGNKVGLWMPNNPEWLTSWFGISKAGGVIVPMDVWYKESEAEYILRHSDSVAVITSIRAGKYDFPLMVSTIMPRLERLKLIVLTGDDPSALADATYAIEQHIKNSGLDITVMTMAEEIESGTEWRDDPRLEEIDEQVATDDPAFILYTSGTTGVPKGATLSHGNVVPNARTQTDIMGLDSTDIFLIPVPYSHAFGNILGITAVVTVGGTLVPMRSFEAMEAMRLVEEHGCTVIYGVPTMFIRELESIKNEGFDSSTLRTGIMAGAPCPIDTMKEVREVMGPDIFIIYGLTEAGPIVTMTRKGDPLDKRTETVGRPIPDVEVKIVGDEGVDLAPGMTGELCCKGYNVMLGYYKMPEQTANAIDEDGWLHTGDLAMWTDDGYIRIVGRKKDMVIVGGFNVYPREIEEYLITHPAISEVAVVGIPDHDMGEVVAAAIRLEDGTELDAQGVVDFCYGEMASAKVPRYVAVGIDLPFSGRGKVQKFVLRKVMKQLIDEGRLERIRPSATKR